MATEAKSDSESPLDLRVDVDGVKEELGLKDGHGTAEPSAVDEEDQERAELEKRAAEYATQLVSFEAGESSAADASRAAVEVMGRDLQREAAHRSKMLQQPVKDLSRRGADGGPVATSLIDLKMHVESLDPNQIDFSPGWVTRFIGMVPGIGTPLKRYFAKYESAQTMVDATIKSLEKGRDQLSRDNVTLRDDQQAMRGLTVKIGKQILLAELLDGQLQLQLDRKIPADDDRHQFVQEELMFPLRQRTMDLQQQLAVNQQGVLATEIVVRNNRELIRGVDRAIDVTVSALQVAVAVALALANQQIVLEKITAVSKTTSDLITGTAERLRTQGAEIHTQATQPMVDMDALRSAFADINAAIDEIARFRRDALPQMAQTIVEFDELSATAEEAIQRVEKAQDVRPVLELDAD